MVKIKNPLLRVLATITTLLLALIAAVGLIYGVGLISPITRSIVFVMVFGAPSFPEIIASGVITIILAGILGFILWLVCRLTKYIYGFYS